MRDEYVGDIGDFGKFILLNELSALCGDNHKIGINWYYNICPTPAFRYLSNGNLSELTDMAGVLFTQLKNIHENRMPRLLDINKGKVIPEFKFYSAAIPYPKIINDREGARNQWFKDSHKDLREINIVFLDPDNGIAPPTVKKSHVNIRTLRVRL